MKKIISFIMSKLPVIRLEEDSTRIHTQFIIIFFSLSIISSFMTALNYITQWFGLARLTLFLAIECGVCLAFETFAKKRNTIMLGRAFFAIATGLILIEFATVGEPEGFSILWSLLMPAAGFFLFRIKYGVITSSALFVIIAYLFWTPAGNSLLNYEYTVTFKQRFPIIYLAFFVIGFIFETVRAQTQKALVDAKQEYEHLYRHDMLTGLYNRYGFNLTLDEYVKERKDNAFGFAILDIDFFKSINDQYGHLEGDVVLKEIAKRISECMPVHSISSRWGGEEFSILLRDEKDAETVCNILLDRQRNEKIKIGKDKVEVHVSIGLVIVDQGQKFEVSEVVKQADNNLYQAKKTGRNKLVVTKYENV